MSILHKHLDHNIYRLFINNKDILINGTVH